jgi:hypothetical protein
MSKPVTIEVTQRDISRGVPADCSKCPVALAVRRATKIRKIAADTSGLFRIAPYTEFARFTAKHPARKFIKDFDAGEPVEPFSFEVEL